MLQEWRRKVGKANRVGDAQKRDLLPYLSITDGNKK